MYNFILSDFSDILPLSFQLSEKKINNFCEIWNATKNEDFIDEILPTELSLSPLKGQ